MQRSYNKPSLGKNFYVPLVATTVLAVILFILEVAGVTHIFHPVRSTSFPTTPTTGGPAVNGQKGEPKDQSTNNSPSAQPGDTKSDTGGSEASALTAPYGGFVSNHYPGKNGSPLTEVSVCNTTPGATCQITFTLGAATKFLPPQTTDRGGSAYWNNWAPQDIGLTTGSWQIKAIATLNGQTRASTDSNDLVVSQ